MLRPVAEFRYAQFCPLARAAEVVGNRWSLLVLRELMVGPQRFSDLKRRLAGVSTSVLSERLAALEAFEVITQAELPPPGAVRVYQLTPHGAAFRPILLDLARWGLHWLSAPSTGDHFEAGWLRLGLEAFAAPAPTPARRFALRVAGGDETAQIRFEGGAACPADAFRFDHILRFPETCRVRNPDNLTAEDETDLDDVPGRPGNVGDDGRLAPGETIQNGGLAGVGWSDNRDPEPVADTFSNPAVAERGFDLRHQ
jgi:DNA-binding HxlR family transcriptional regulator